MYPLGKWFVSGMCMDTLSKGEEEEDDDDDNNNNNYYYYYIKNYKETTVYYFKICPRKPVTKATRAERC